MLALARPCQAAAATALRSRVTTTRTPPLRVSRRQRQPALRNTLAAAAGGEDASGGAGSMANPLEAAAQRPGRLHVHEGILPARAKGAVFDMDGTLLDSNDHRVESWASSCSKRGLSIDKAKYMEQTGKSGRDIVDRLCSEQGVELPDAERQALVEEEGQIFKRQGLPHSRPIDVVMDIVRAAKERGLRMAVCSGGQQDVVKQALAERGLEGEFEVVVTSKDVPHAKPEPDIYLLAAERLGLQPGECVAYEDAQMGVASARAAGYLLVVDVTRLRGHPEHEEERQ